MNPRARRNALNRRLLCGFGAVALTMVGCSWGQAGFDSGRAGWNSTDSTITPQSIGAFSLSWTAAGEATNGAAQVAPVMDAHRIFVVSGGTLADGRLDAYALDGGPNCTGTPRVCAPLWTAALPLGIRGEPVVADGRVFVGSDSNGSWQLRGYDAAGAAGCGGSPRVCAPLLVASLPSNVSGGPMAVSGGRVFVSATGFPELGSVSATYVFDGTGNEGCTGGAPVTCAPLFTAVGDTLPVVAGGLLYLGTATGAAAFDANGQSGCGGAPRTCNALRTFVAPRRPSSLAVANGSLFLATSEPHFSGPWIGSVYSFDAWGPTGCNGAPPACSPQWSASTGYTELPVIADGRLYLQKQGAFQTDSTLEVFDARGEENCGGVPRTCGRLRSAVLPSAYRRAAANRSLLFATTTGTGLPDTGRLVAFALDGGGCEGSPLVCSPLLSIPIAPQSTPPAVGGGRIAFVTPSSATQDWTLNVYGLTT